MERVAFTVALVVCAHAVVSAHAAAQSSVDEGWRRVLAADFDGALAAFDEAEAGTLTRAELVRVFEGRAHVHYALGRAAALEAALARLAAMAPEHRLAPETPPELVERFARLADRRRLTLEVELTESETEARLEARAEGDPGGLVRHVRVAARVGDGAWLEAQDEPLILPIDAARALAYYGEALGPGGAVVARDGSREAPHLREGASGGDDAPWGWIALGAGAAVVIGVVIAIVVAATAPADTQPSPPRLP
ncbi:MAG: hypothetical protein KF729_21775 [Sandaracinaceae bacterium]|nr:hypothetical protein [Sandaracinaceae bacterium]